MVELNFYISDEDFDRLYAIKEARGAADLTGNEFARELLQERLWALHPGTVRTQEED